MSLKRQVYNKDYEFRSTEYVNARYPEGFERNTWNKRYCHENKRLRRYLTNGIKEFYESR